MSQSSGSSLSASGIALIALVDARARRLQQQVLFFEYLTPKLRGRQQGNHRLTRSLQIVKLELHVSTWSSRHIEAPHPLFSSNFCKLLMQHKIQSVIQRLERGATQETHNLTQCGSAIRAAHQDHCATVEMPKAAADHLFSKHYRCSKLWNKRPHQVGMQSRRN